MPEVKISDLPITTSASTGDYIPVVEGGVTKRVQAGLDGGIEAGDAGKVSRAGIGSVTVANMADLDSTTTIGGIFRYAVGTPGTHPAGANDGIVIVARVNEIELSQIAIPYGSLSEIYTRTYVGSGWTTWAKTWNSANDGLDSLLEAGDAGKVSRFGWGVDAPSLGTGGFGKVIKGGAYSVVETTGWPVANAGNVICVSRSGGYDFFIGWAEDNAVYRGFRAAGTTGTITWNKMWDSQTDGNAGQPPAPKPTSSEVIGQIRNAIWTGATTDVPSGGTWMIWYVDFSGQQALPYILAGGATISSSNVANKCICWRIA